MKTVSMTPLLFSVGHLRRACVVVLVPWAQMLAAQTLLPSSEQDFFADLPVVLSVSRLPQRLDEAPGAVTVLDREFIRMSGARDLADLLRLVPGFQVSTTFESGAPLASYHGAFNIYSGRIELLIDGRSAYSPYFIGNVAPGMLSVALTDIERIEVLRGSNSAAYGARAILGVVNVVTRHSADTLGALGAIKVGQNGIRDVQARLGWTHAGHTVRLGVDRRADDGLQGAYNANQVTRLNVRSDIAVSAQDEVQLLAGANRIDSGKGTAGDPSDMPHMALYQSEFAQLDWRRALGAQDDLLLRLSHTQERYRDEFPYSLAGFGIPDAINIGVSGRSASTSLLLQHSHQHNPALRWVWGGEYRNEHMLSRALFNRDDALVTEFSRLFGNLEWHLAPTWLLNAGAMAEHSSVTGRSLAPRLMLNWQFLPGQTLRAGVSRAFRPPSNFEQFGHIRYEWRGRLLSVTTLSRAGLDAERVTTREISYLGEFAPWGLSLDARAFDERMDAFIIPKANARPRYYVNSDGFDIRGLEYQLKWRPWPTAVLVLNQTYTRIAPVAPFSAADLAAPRLSSSLAWMQKLPHDVELSLSHQHQGVMRFIGSGWDRQPALRRTDLRVAKHFKWGEQRGELALVVYNLGPAYADFDPTFLFRRQAWLGLSVAY